MELNKDKTTKRNVLYTCTCTCILSRSHTEINKQAPRNYSTVPRTVQLHKSPDSMPCNCTSHMTQRPATAHKSHDSQVALTREQYVGEVPGDEVAEGEQVVLRLLHCARLTVRARHLLGAAGKRRKNGRSHYKCRRENQGWI